MRLPPSVISLIESHLIPSTGKQTLKPGFQALAPTLKPNIRSSPTTQDALPTRLLSVKSALTRYPHIPSIAIAAAHRVLAQHAEEPSTSSKVAYLIRRQRLYERLIRTFSNHFESERVTIPSLFARMVDEGVPPNLDTLKIVISAAGRNGVPVLPILRQVLEMDGLPDELDTHLLGLVMKALVREGGMKAVDLEKMIKECSEAGVFRHGERPIVMDEVLVEAYGQAGDLRGILDVLTRYRSTETNAQSQTPSHNQPSTDTQHRGPILSLYLQALRQWTSIQSIRRKRRGPLFPRVLAKDVIELYGGTDEIPTIWLNAWMNAERMTGDKEAAMTVWRLLMIGNSADQVSYSTYFRLSKLLSANTANLRQITHALVHHQHIAIKSISIDTVESALSAAFHHDDLPLALYYARHVIANGLKVGSVSRLTERTIDVIASGIVRSWRRGGLDITLGLSPITTNQVYKPTLRPRSKSHVVGSDPSARPEYIMRDEWDAVSNRLNAAYVDVALPLSRPLGRLHSTDAQQGVRSDDLTVMTFRPNEGTSNRSQLVRLGNILKGLVGVLEEAIVERNREPGELGGEVLRRVMQDLHREILPPR